MKCNQCGYVNKEGAKYCTSCGASLFKTPSIDTVGLVRLAEAYTGSLAAAKKIASENSQDIHSIALACVAWIRSKDATLFQDAKEKEEGIPTLDSFVDMEKTLRDLDYEERIVVLMHCLEKESPATIAQILNLSESQVIYYLQTAYIKNHPAAMQKEAFPVTEKKKPVKRKKTVRRKVKDTNSEGSKLVRHLSMPTKIALAVTIAVAVGTFFGVKKYAADEYQRGVAYLEEQNYGAALEPLLNAKRYGGSEDAGVKLGDVYYQQEEYSKALQEYQDCRPEQKGVKEALIRTYEKLADQAVAQSNYGTAAENLEKQYELDENDRTHLRLQAVQNDGSYTDDSGNVYNAWGDPTKLCAVSNGKKLYQVDLEYNEDRSLKTMKEYISDDTSKIIYNQFSNDKEVEASWMLQSDGAAAYSVQAVMNDEQGNPILNTVTTPSSVKKTITSYKYDDDNQIVSTVIKNTSTTVTGTYHYSGGILTDIQYNDGSSTTFTYDKAGNKIHEATTKENGDILLDLSYEYDNHGRLKEKIIKQQDPDSILPSVENQDITYTYTSTGNYDTLTIHGRTSEIAKGYYLQNTGWIILYTNK